MCKIADYWPRVRLIPLYPDFETDDGDAVICRAQGGEPVRVTKPEALSSDDEREAIVKFYEDFYSPRSHRH